MKILKMWYYQKYYGYSTNNHFGYIKFGEIKNQEKALKQAIFEYCLKNNFTLFEKLGEN